MKLTINIPETLNEVTLKQYQKWLKIAEGKELDSFLQQKMVEIFCNIPLKQVLQIKATDINNICEELSKLFNNEPKFIDRFTLNDKEFGFIPKLDDISFGEYVDLDTYLADWDLMNKAIGVLYRPITYKKKKQYLIEEYESAEKYDMTEVTLDIVVHSLPSPSFSYEELCVGQSITFQNTTQSSSKLEYVQWEVNGLVDTAYDISSTFLKLPEKKEDIPIAQMTSRTSP